MKTLNVSERTKQEIAKFFLRTSVPRILAAEHKDNARNEKILKGD